MNSPMRLRRWLAVLSCSLTVAPVTCHSIFEKSQHVPEDDEYEYVTVSGSMIPQKVKKGTRGATVGATSEMSAQEFDKFRQRNQAPGPKLGGS